MNRKLSVILYIILCVAIVLLSYVCAKTIRDNKRVKQNYEAIKKDSALQQELTRSELKEYYENELKRLKALGVKTKQVERIVKTSYTYRDTTRYHDSLIFIYDTISNAPLARFEIEAACQTITGYVVDNEISIDEIVSHDTLMLCLYKQKKKCIFEKRKYRALVLSYCTGDTMQTFSNILVK